MNAHAAHAFKLELAHCGQASCRVAGTSMGSSFTGCEIQVERAPEPREGDVVVVESGGRLVVHRLVRLDAHQMITRGDAMPVCDAPLPRTALLGRVVALTDARGLTRRPPGPHRALAFGFRSSVRRLLRRHLGL